MPYIISLCALHSVLKQILNLGVVPAGGIVMNGFGGGTVVSPDQARLNGGKPCGRGGSCPGRGNPPERPRRQTAAQTLEEKQQLFGMSS